MVWYDKDEYANEKKISSVDEHAILLFSSNKYIVVLMIATYTHVI